VCRSAASLDHPWTSCGTSRRWWRDGEGNSIDTCEIRHHWLKWGVARGLSPTCSGLPPPLLRFEPNLAKNCHAQLWELSNVLRIRWFSKPQHTPKPISSGAPPSTALRSLQHPWLSSWWEEARCFPLQQLWPHSRIFGLRPLSMHTTITTVWHNQKRLTRS